MKRESFKRFNHFVQWNSMASLALLHQRRWTHCVLSWNIN